MPHAAQLRTVSDERLLAQCRVEAFRGPGPGGQKRNKTSSAVRITHVASGLCAIAGESRSQHRNKAAALWRLRHRLAVELRESIDVSTFVPPPWLRQAISDQGRLDVPLHSECYPQVMGLVLDVLSASGWRLSTAAALIGLSTAHLVRFIEKDRKVWAKVNQMRPGSGHKTLHS